MWDLNNQLVGAAGWTELTSAQAINDVGQITCYGSIGGHVHSFLLTPRALGSSVRQKPIEHPLHPLAIAAHTAPGLS